MIDPYQALEVDQDAASDQTVRKAYLAAVSRFPPDGDPDAFDRIRRAYDLIKTERDRLKLRVFGVEDAESLSVWLSNVGERRRAGARTWIASIQTEASRQGSSSETGRVDPT